MTLKVESLGAGYGKLAILHEVSLEVAAGEIVTVVGSNGAGKTTLLRAINGILKPTTGRVTLEGADITGR
ncbi:MAG TPA: ATP-binding cassette domain-containing protein, partial [Agromyces sp.]